MVDMIYPAVTDALVARQWNCDERLRYAPSILLCCLHHQVARKSTFGPFRAFFELINSVRKLVLEGKSFDEVDHTLAGSLW